MTAVGTKVIAYSKTFNKTAYVIGEGTYIGDKVPDTIPFNILGMENPCIALGDGKFTWGFQCWWGEKEAAERKFRDFEHVQLEGEELEEYTSIRPLQPTKREEVSDGPHR